MKVGPREKAKIKEQISKIYLRKIAKQLVADMIRYLKMFGRN